MNNLIDLIFSENDKYALYKSTFKKTFIENKVASTINKAINNMISLYFVFICSENSLN